MPFTFRNVVQRPLYFSEADENLQTMEDMYTEALQAQDAATLNAGIYASTTAGLAATTNGQYFSVPSAGTDVYLELYRNNAGSAVLTKTYYSRPQAAMEEIGSYSALNAYSGSASVFYLRGRTSLFDGAHGVFRRDDTDTTSADNGGTILVDALSRRWKREFSGPVNVKWFGATGDGSTDDTTAIHAAVDIAKLANGAAFFPGGRYRVTSGYTNASSDSVALIGEGVDYTASTSAASSGSTIILDSVSASSFFFSQTAQNQLTVRDMQFSCAQYVLDRKFFKQSASSVKHVFENVVFVAVEQPFVYDAGTYFQHSTYTNIRFTNSGSFHSKTSDLIGTLMTIINCDLEGTVPANTEKIICNLAGIRQINGMNFLIEPSTPASGWIGLFLRNAYDPDWTRAINATFVGFWMEVTGSGLQYSIYQERGRTMLIDGHLGNGATAPYRLNEKGSVEFVNTQFTGTADALQSYFYLNDYACQVKLTNCTYRNPGTAITDPRFTFSGCSHSPDGASAPFTATSHNNEQSQLLWAFDGGYPDPGKVLAQAFGGTAITPSTNATFGRVLSITPSAGTINAQFQGRLRNDFQQGGQMFVVVRGTLPNIPSGSLEMNFLFDSVSIGGGKVWLPADSNADFRTVLPVTAQTANPTTMGVTFQGSADTTSLKLYQFEIWVGKSMPNVTMPSYPQNIVTYSATAPAAGTWAHGDIVKNNAPAVGSPKGWVCTVAGTPGTWVSEGNL